jgi:ribosomal protein S18 acetylase RimI-like enzyme
MPRTDLTVRSATPADLVFIASVVPRLFSHRSGWRTEREMVDGTVLQLEEAIAQPSGRHIVVIAESPAGEPLGFAYAALKPDYFTRELHGYLEEIVTLRDGEGIGAVLLRAVEAWAFGHGSRYVELSVLDRNANAIAFYERSGYAIDVRKMLKLRPESKER